jgi:hypothetical protein
MVWQFKWRYAWYLSAWTGITENGSRYQQYIDNPSAPFELLTLKNATAGGYDLTGTWDHSLLPLEIYGLLPDGGAGAYYGNGDGPFTLDQWLDSTGINSNSSITDWAGPVMELTQLHPSDSFLPYAYWMLKSWNSSSFTSWNWADNPGGIIGQYVSYDPTISSSNVSGLTTQYLFKDTSLAACRTLWGSQVAVHTWGSGTPATDTPGCYPNMSFQHAISKSDWTGTATQVWMSASWGSVQLDRAGGGQYGAYHIYRNGYLLAGDAAVGAKADAATGSAHDTSGLGGSGLASDMVIEIGGVDNWNVMESNANVGANFARWASTDPSGDSASRYVYSMIDMTPTYLSSANVTRANRHIIHFKKASAQDYVVSYDDVALSSSNEIQAWWHYSLNGMSGTNTVSVNTSARTVTNTLSGGNGKLLTSFLPVQGTNTVALLSNGASNNTWKTYTCPSTDGTSCSNSTSGEWIAVHQPCNGTSCTMPTLTQPSCTGTGGNCTAVQIADSTGPKVAVFARQGALVTGESVVSTHSGTAQYLFTGLTPGTYAASLNGANFATGIVVAANDNTAYVESSSGTVAMTQTGGGSTSAAATPSFTPAAGTYSSTQTVTISTTTPSATIYYTTNGSTPTTSSAVYSGPITVSVTETLQAIAVAPGYSNSTAGWAAYTIITSAAATPAFTVVVSPGSLTVTAGQSSTTTVMVVPQNSFASAVSFSCSGLPSGASCSFSQPTVTPTGTVASTALTVTTSTTNTAFRRNSSALFPGSALAVVLCCFGWKKRRGLQMLLALVALGLSLFTGCGGVIRLDSQAATHTTTSTVTVIATGGSLQQTASFTLTVQ